MISKEFFPAAPLNQLIESLYYVKGDLGNGEKFILPDMKTDLVFLFDTNVTLLEENGAEITFSDSLVHGFRRSLMKFRYNGHTEMLGIRFLPFGFTQMFNIPKEELMNFIEIQDLPCQYQFIDLHERVFSEIDISEKFRLIVQWLMSVFLKRRAETTLAIRAIQYISKTRGVEKLSVICNNSPSEYKQLQRFCHDELDICPKHYARMVRFEHIHKTIIQNPAPDWISLVDAFRLTDQSHLIRECRHFTGKSPKEFFATNRMYI